MHQQSLDARDELQAYGCYWQLYYSISSASVQWPSQGKLVNDTTAAATAAPYCAALSAQVQTVPTWRATSSAVHLGQDVSVTYSSGCFLLSRFAMSMSSNFAATMKSFSDSPLRACVHSSMLTLFQPAAAAQAATTAVVLGLQLRCRECGKRTAACWHVFSTPPCGRERGSHTRVIRSKGRANRRTRH